MNTKPPIDHPIQRLIERVHGRKAMNLRSAEQHTEHITRIESVARINAYTTVLLDIQELVPDLGSLLLREQVYAAFAARIDKECGREVGDTLMRFVGVMCEKLEENKHKGGWSDDTLEQLLQRLRNELVELEAEILARPNWKVSSNTKRDPKSIARECADVANFAMMIADVAGGLKDE